MTTSEEVMRALKAVFDPEIGINIVDLGLVYGATVEDATVKIDMTLTSPACPLAPVIEAQANAILTSNFEDVEAFLKRTGAQLWIQHDLAAFRKLKLAPAYYE